MQSMHGLNWIDNGARFRTVGCGDGFLGVDPLCEKYYWISPYAYCADDPVKLIDPDGRWVPNSEGNLIAEQGDDAGSLAKFQNISFDDAFNQLQNAGYSLDCDGVLNLEIGDVLSLDNVFTQSIDNSTSDLTLETARSGTSTTGATPEDNYNCWGSAIAGSQGQGIKVGVGIPTGDIFDNKLENQYTPTTASDAQFGTTVLRFANKSNKVQHGAVFYGSSQDGTVYVYTKNGWYLKPTVMKLSDLQSKIPTYGTIQGINSSNSGYYNPKK
jgi:hypothetical protein